MKQHSNLRFIATTACCVVATLFFLLYIYLFFFENVSVYSNRHAHTYDELITYSVSQIEDASAPIGVRTEYRMIVDNHESSESCLCFYLVHHYADVYIDGELILSLNASENNRIGDTISSNWVTVPIHEDDSGKEMVIVLTPLFKNMVNFEPEFLVGSHYSIIIDQFKEDILQLFLAFICIVLSVLITVTQVYFMSQTSNKKWDLLYLAAFAFLLGLWRITDMKTAPILFSKNPMVLGYITIGSLFLCSLFLQLFVSTFFSKKRGNQLLIVSLVSTTIVFAVWILQVTGISEFKSLLSISHVLLIVSLVNVFIFSILSKKDTGHKPNALRGRLFIILGIGIIIDIACYYIFSSSSSVIFALLAFIAYTLVVFVTSILETTRKAQLDSPTGLLNKSRWNELMQNVHLDEDVIGMVMIDLNDLKIVNDLYGHEVGDQMIYDFSKILKESFPPSCAICRWGGDEFVIMTENKDTEKLEQYIENLDNAVIKYNSDLTRRYLSFAVGYCISTDYPEADHTELLKIADSKMYSHKNKIKKGLGLI